jgi:hydrogenase expression/formation protein HypC
MCLGLPMQIVRCEGDVAWARFSGEERKISLLLIGPQEVGTRVLVNIDTAVRTIDEAEAALIESALQGVAAAARGEATDHYFADLINREPELPEHLRSTPSSETTHGEN